MIKYLITINAGRLFPGKKKIEGPAKEGNKAMRKTAFLTFLALITGFLFASNSNADFVSGSTGADGAFSPTSNTVLQLPPNGVFNFTSVYIPSGVTVTFTPNAANTPVYILATNDVTIAGTINVSGGNAVSITAGAGGPGGFAGGYGGGSGTGGNGLGPGGGIISTPGSCSQHGGCGGFGSNGGSGCGGTGGTTYGNSSLVPLIGGSGGAGGNYEGCTNNNGFGGGGGGGVLLIASSGTINVTGSILANGGNAYALSNGWTSGGSGSGGAIRLIANVIAGDGTISAVGGATSCSGNGGNGWIRLEANTFTRTAGTSPSDYTGFPSTVFISNAPSIQITSIGGVAVPQNATGSYSTLDITLPSSTTNPVPVGLAATNVPTGTVITVSVVPYSGTASSFASSGLSGTQQYSTATASVNLSLVQRDILMAQATFAIQTSMYYNGEKIEKVTVAAEMGKDAKVTYITESGKQIPAGKLMASLGGLSQE